MKSIDSAILFPKKKHCVTLLRFHAVLLSTKKGASFLTAYCFPLLAFELIFPDQKATALVTRPSFTENSLFVKINWTKKVNCIVKFNLFLGLLVILQYNETKCAL